MPSTYDFAFLFRYRDLVADTLPEHRNVLRENGYCWWGWWKRPNEEPHQSVWSVLQQETAKGGRVRIGLFHSGSGEIHQAIIDKVVVPQEDDYGNLKSVVPEDQSAVPAYYRESRHSRAWVRIVSIGDQPFSFFGTYSYAERPLLAGYGTKQLDRFVGKKVLDPDELRAMDTTIWVVRRATENDHSDRIITAQSDYDQPILERPVQCQGEWLLHISDLHYATGNHRWQHQWRLESEPTDGVPTMVDAINEAIIRENRTIGAVLVSGDLTFIGTNEEFDIARKGLYKLTNGLLGLNLEHLIVIPGNHDIAWTQDGSYKDDSPVDVAPDVARANYEEFFRRLYGFRASVHLGMARRFVFPGGNLIDIAAVNSSSLEQGHDYLAGMGRVQEAGYRAATEPLRWNSSNGLSLRILAMHHHLALTEDLESPNEFRRGFGISIDAPRIQRMAARNGVHLAVHGHKHRAFVWRSGAYELPEHTQDHWELGEFNIIGGGSAGSTATEGGRNYFNLIRLSAGTVEVEMYRSHNRGSFERFISWSADLRTGVGGKLAISPWKKMSG